MTENFISHGLRCVMKLLFVHLISIDKFITAFFTPQRTCSMGFKWRNFCWLFMHKYLWWQWRKFHELPWSENEISSVIERVPSRAYFFTINFVVHVKYYMNHSSFALESISISLLCPLGTSSCNKLQPNHFVNTIKHLNISSQFTCGRIFHGNSSCCLMLLVE